MKNKIGVYTGKPVYKVSMTEYICHKYYEDNKNIYLIDEVMVDNNIAFARYYGGYVHDYDAKDRAIFYKIPSEKPKTANFSKTELENSLAIGKSVDEIIAAAYTGVWNTDAAVDDILRKALEK